MDMNKMKLSEGINEVDRKHSPVRAWTAALLAWALPGMGHVWLGRVGRGFLLGGAVWGLFLGGLLLRGHLYSLFNSTTGLLSYVFGIFNLGSGLLYVACWVLDVGVVDQAREQTSEYGNVFLMIAGLLNYLLSLDAFDIGSGRKS